METTKAFGLPDEPVLGAVLAPVSPPTLELLNADLNFLMALINSLFFLQVISFIIVFQLVIFSSK